MSFGSICYERQDGVAKIILNRPDKLNAWSVEMREETAVALGKARDDSAVRALVITGAGRAFSAGGDVRSFDPSSTTADAGRARVHRADRIILQELLNIPKPVIAMVNGLAIGIGSVLAAASDIVIASDTAQFGFPFVRIGLMPDLGGIFLLPRLLGMHKAKELTFTGDVIDAAEALRIGLVNKVVPAAGLEGTVMALAMRLAAGPTIAIGMTKVLLHRALATDIAAAVELEALGQGICMQTEDHREGVSAFLEKRAPQFKGR